MRDPAPQPQVPLCVDLDGTLLLGDLLVESLSRLLRRRPHLLAMVPVWLAGGRARLKAELARRVEIDPAGLVYDTRLVELLQRERASGRRLILVTASHERPARRVAAHLGLFDEVIASDGDRNLKGREKRAELDRRFGAGGYDYAGDSRADLAVWSGAREAIVVNAGDRTVRALGDRKARVLPRRRRPLPLAVLRAMRLQQWAKNLLLFVPVTLAHRVFEPAMLGRTGIGFVAFGLGASAVYVLNDMLDVEADRAHPVKKNRPFASGDLPLELGFVLFPVLLAASLGLSLLLPRGFLLVLGIYFVLTTLYSLVLKELELVDVLILASLYTLRILAGSQATGIPVTEWLFGFSMFLFLSLGALKRYAELRRVRAESGSTTRLKRRGYRPDDLDLLVPMGLSSGYLSALVLALYINNEAVTVLYGRPGLLWFACPLILYWTSRVWLLAHRGEVEEDPLQFALRDRVTWLVGVLGAVIVGLAARGW